MMKVKAERHEGMYQTPTGFGCMYTVADAANKLGVSESSIRRAARKAGVRRIRGRVVAGMVSVWRRTSHHGSTVSRPVYMPYAD